MVGPMKKGRGLTCLVSGGTIKWRQHPLPSQKSFRKFPVSVIKRHQDFKLVSIMWVKMRFVSGQNGCSPSVWMVPWKSLRKSTMSGKAGDSRARHWSKSSRIAGTIQTLFCSSVFVQELVQLLSWISFTCESYFEPSWTRVYSLGFPSSSTPFPTKETFCAEVEILRAEMQSSELVVEGEFLTHEGMIEKGISEHFGIRKSLKIMRPSHTKSLLLARKNFKHYWYNIILSWTTLHPCIYFVIINHLSPLAQAEGWGCEEALQDQPPEAHEAQTLLGFIQPALPQSVSPAHPSALRCRKDPYEQVWMYYVELSVKASQKNLG